MDQIYTEMTEAYKTAVAEYRRQTTEWYPCGIVSLKIKSNSKLAKYLLSVGRAVKQQVGTTVLINPTGEQHLYTRLAGVEAVGRVLDKHGIQYTITSHLD